MSNGLPPGSIIIILDDIRDADDGRSSIKDGTGTSAPSSLRPTNVRNGSAEESDRSDRSSTAIENEREREREGETKRRASVMIILAVTLRRTNNSANSRGDSDRLCRSLRIASTVTACGSSGVYYNTLLA